MKNAPFPLFSPTSFRSGKFTLTAKVTALIAVMALVFSQSAQAASATWNASPTNGIWEAVAGENNWSTGDGTFPGAIGATTNADVATFLTSSTTTISINSTAGNSSPLNIGGMTFGSSTSTSPSSFTIGSTGGNALWLSSGGTISINSNVVAGANATETINAPLVLQPTNSTSTGSYTFSNAASSSNNTLVIGGPISTGTTSGIITLSLTGANAGANKITGGVSDTNSGGLIISKASSGTWTYGGNGSSSLAKGNINVTGGTFNFGVASTDAPTLSIAASTGQTVGLYVTGSASTFNMANGSLTVNASPYGLLFSGAGGQTFNQTGGTFSTGFAGFSDGGGSTAVTINGNSSFTATTKVELAVRGTTTFTLAGTATVTTPSLVMNTSQLGSGTASGTFNLNGGTLLTGGIINGTGGPTGVGNTFNFNGGTLKSSASNGSFMTGITNAFVKAGGALINTNGFNDTIGQNLLTGGGTDGGLTLNDTATTKGTLTLSGTNTYTGPTTISGGTLAATTVANGGSASAIGASSNAAANLVINGGTLQYTGATASTDRNFTVGTGGAAIDASGSGALTISGSPTLATNAATSTLTLTGTNAGGNDFTGTLTATNATGGLILAKSGTGSWTLGGNAISTLTKGQINETVGTLSFGSTSEVPTVNLNGQTGTGGNVGVYVRGGTFNMVAGNLTTNNTSQGLVVQGTGTIYNQTGGTLTTSGFDFIEFANNGTTTQNISGGTLQTGANGRIELNVNGTSSVTTLSGTGTIITPSVVALSNQTNNNSSTSTFNLGNGTVGGGTLVTGSFGHGTSTGTGATTFNFNGGTLQASATSSAFMSGLTAANVKAGGAIINTSSFSDTITQALQHDSGLGATADGGLTKLGTGTLTLAGANTYTGATTVKAGTLALDFNAATAPATNIVSSSSALTLSGSTLSVLAKSNTATSQTVNGLTLNSGGSGVSVSPAAVNPNAVVLNLGSITRNSGATVNFTLPTGGQNSTYGITTTTANTAGTILGGWATAGLNDWAVSGGNGTTAGNITPLSSYFVYDNVAGWNGAGANSTSNMTDSNGYDATYTLNITLNSLRFNAGGSDSNVGVVSGNNLTLGSGGLLVTNNVGAKYQRIGFLNTAFTAGQGQGGLTSSASDLIINQNNSGAGHLEIYSTIFGDINLVKSGAGFLDLKGLSASYTGATIVNAGTFQVSGGDDRLPTGTAMTINGGTFALNGVNQTIGSLSGSAGGVIDNNGASKTLTVNQSTNTTYAGVLKNTTNALSLTKQGIGTLALIGANTYTGTTTVAASGGTLQVDNNGVNTFGKITGTSAAGSITVGNGGTLLLSGAGNNDRIANNAGTTLAAGSTLAIGPTGNSNLAVLEGTGAHNQGGTFTGTNTTGLGALTLTGNATLDMGASGVGTLNFASFTPGGFVLSITNYTSIANSAANISGTDGADDRLIFATDQASNLASFNFNGLSAQEIALGGTYFEIVPVPEPSTYAAGLLTLLAIGYTQRRRLRALVVKWA